MVHTDAIALSYLLPRFLSPRRHCWRILAYQRCIWYVFDPWDWLSISDEFDDMVERSWILGFGHCRYIGFLAYSMLRRTLITFNGSW